MIKSLKKRSTFIGNAVKFLQPRIFDIKKKESIKVDFL